MDANLRQQTRSISPKFWHDQRGSLSFKPPEPAGKDMDFSCDKHYTAGKWEKKEIQASARAHTCACTQVKLLHMCFTLGPKSYDLLGCVRIHLCFCSSSQRFQRSGENLLADRRIWIGVHDCVRSQISSIYNYVWRLFFKRSSRK